MLHQNKSYQNKSASNYLSIQDIQNQKARLIFSRRERLIESIFQAQWVPVNRKLFLKN